jgi:hypothetical protein
LVAALVQHQWDGTGAKRDPLARLKRLILVQWTDPVPDPRSSVLRATTNVVYGNNGISESHALTGTLTGSFARVATNVEMLRTPPVVIQDYAANESPEHGAITFVQMATPARQPSPARRR